MIIDVQNLTVRYHETVAVKNFHLQLHKGEVVGLLGANGAGKSSTLHALLGIQESTYDTLTLLGKSPIDQRKEVFQKVAVQFQETNFQDRLSVMEACEQWQALYKESANVDQLLQLLGLENKKIQLVKSLSGGERQRLAVLLALLPKPELVFLDELTTGMDTKARRMLWKRLLDMKTQGLSIILTSHYMDEVEALCDRLVILRDGAIIIEGAIPDIIKASGKNNLEEAYLVFAGEEEWL